MASKWKMITEFGKAVGKKVGKPNKTSKMIEGVGESKLAKNVDEWDAFNAGRNSGTSMKEAATDEAYQAMYDRLDDDARAVLSHYDLDIERAYGPDHAYAKALEDAKLDAHTDIPTDRFGWQEKYGFDISKPAPRQMDVAKRTERLAGEESNKALENSFDEGFEDAAKRRKKERLNEWDWDGENQKSDADAWDYEAAKDREAEAERQVRDELIQKLKSGMPLSDFFEKYGQRLMD